MNDINYIKFTCNKTNITILVYENTEIKKLDGALVTQHTDQYGYKYITLKVSKIRVNYR